jgi:hypothetical protein
LCHEIPDQVIAGVDVKAVPAAIEPVVAADRVTTLFDTEVTYVLAARPVQVAFVPLPATVTILAAFVKGKAVAPLGQVALVGVNVNAVPLNTSRVMAFDNVTWLTPTAETVVAAAIPGPVTIKPVVIPTALEILMTVLPDAASVSVVKAEIAAATVVLTASVGT